jgi:hypothetical protein
MSPLLSLSVLLLLQTSPSPSAEPRVFAPGVVSTGQDEFGAAFSPDGNTVVFNRADPSRFGFQVLLISHWKRGRWTPPEILPFSGRYRDIDPAFSVDGRRLFFASNRPQTDSEQVHADFDIWLVERTDKGWGMPRLAEGANTAEDETNTSLTRDGVLYVTRSPKGGVRRIFRHAPTDSGWAPGEQLPEVINSGKGDGNHCVDQDERYLVFASQRPGGSSSYDLYVSERNDKQWSEPRNLGPALNGTDGGLTPVVVPARGTLVYAQRRPFLSAPLQRALTTQEFAARLESPGNGLGDLYEVPLAAVGLPASAR